MWMWGEVIAAVCVCISKYKNVKSKTSPVVWIGSKRAVSTPTSERWLSPLTLTDRWTSTAKRPSLPTEATSCTRTRLTCMPCQTLPIRPWRGVQKIPASSFQVCLIPTLKHQEPHWPTVYPAVLKIQTGFQKECFYTLLNEWASHNVYFEFLLRYNAVLTNKTNAAFISGFMKNAS